MAKSRGGKQKIEGKLEYLKQVQASGKSETTLIDVRDALNDRVNLIAAKAASIVSEWQAHSLLPDVVAAYSKFFVKASETDPQCWAKNELCKCLKELGWAESAVFIRGLQHYQWESTWGGKTDTAAMLRSTCALALVQCTDITRHETLLHMVSALTESDAGVRTDTVRAIEQMGGRDVSLLLRLKARAGDRQPRVTGQVLESLLSLEGASGVPFVEEFLHNPEVEIAEEAALALGASRLPEALEALKNAWLHPRIIRDGNALLRAISASRQDSAFQFLLEQIQTARPEIARDVLWAMQIHRDSEEIVKRIDDATSEREDLRATFREIYQRKA